MTKTHQAAIVGFAAALGWLATQKVRETVPGTAGVAMGVLAGMVVQTAASEWLEQHI
jgi:ammonia channel protein AmtB